MHIYLRMRTKRCPLTYTMAALVGRMLAQGRPMSKEPCIELINEDHDQEEAQL